MKLKIELRQVPFLNVLSFVIFVMMIHSCFPCSGGLEILFDKVAKHEVELPDKKTIILKDFLKWIKENLVKERPDLFLQDDTVYAPPPNDSFI